MMPLLAPPDWALQPTPCLSQPWLDPVGLLFLVWALTLLLAFMGGAACYKACCVSRLSQNTRRMGERVGKVESQWAAMDKKWKEMEEREKLQRQVDMEKSKSKRRQDSPEPTAEEQSVLEQASLDQESQKPREETQQR